MIMDDLIKDLCSNRENLSEYSKTFDTLLYSFVKTDEYEEMTKRDKTCIVDCCLELKLFITKLIAQTSRQEKTEHAEINCTV
jgi:hypothetical protein